MKSLICILLILFGGSLFITENDLPKNPPKYLEFKLADGQIARAEKAFIFDNPDTLLDHQMYAILDKQDIPVLYYADIRTPVCIDGLCKLLYIEMYWDLTGEYVGYGVHPDQKLSKYDHDYFEEENYEKLHSLLQDPYSVIGRRELKGLYDIQTERTEKIKFKGKEIDGVSGATRKEVKNSIVEGALYSCYTLWRLAYGDAVIKIKDRLPSIYNPEVENYFLSSGWENYNMHAARHLPKVKFGPNLGTLISVVKTVNPVSRSYILKKIPKELFAEQQVTSDLYPYFSDFDFNSKTLLLEALVHAEPQNLVTLADQLTGLSKNQLMIYFDQLRLHPDLQTESLKYILRSQTSDKSFSNAYLVRSFLEELK